jgi:hypothetical protein
VIALAVLAGGAVVIFAVPTLWPVLISNTVMAIVGGTDPPKLTTG